MASQQSSPAAHAQDGARNPKTQSETSSSAPSSAAASASSSSSSSSQRHPTRVGSSSSLPDVPPGSGPPPITMPPPSPLTYQHTPVPLFSPPTGCAPFSSSSPSTRAPHLSPAAILSTNLSSLAAASLASLSTSELLFKARLALQAERFEEMAYFMRVLCLQKSSVLTLEERAMFALAYKKLLGARRMGWRYIYSIEMKEKAAARKIESEIARETDREAREQRERDQQAAAAALKAKEEQERLREEEKTLKGQEDASSKAEDTPRLAKPAVTPTPAPTATSAPPSVLPALQARLAHLTSNLGHIHSYRYQLFYESSLIISEVSSLLIDRLLPTLVHRGSIDFLHRLPGVIEQIVDWERKRTGRAKTHTQTTTAKSAHANGDKSTADSSGVSSSLAASSSISAVATTASAPAVSATLPLTKLDTSRHWSFECELDLQIRTLDDRTRFLSSLRSANAESLVFYCKLLADHRRLLAEFLADRDYEEQERAVQSLHALAYYCLARYIAATTLSPAHPVRLGLQLNCALFYFEVMAKPERACQLASQSYDMALNEWQNRQSRSDADGSRATDTDAAPAGVGVGAAPTSDADAAVSSSVDGTYKDSLLIMQLLKNNLAMWTRSL